MLKKGYFIHTIVKHRWCSSDALPACSPSREPAPSTHTCARSRRPRRSGCPWPHRTASSEADHHNPQHQRCKEAGHVITTELPGLWLNPADFQVRLQPLCVVVWGPRVWVYGKRQLGSWWSPLYLHDSHVGAHARPGAEVAALQLPELTPRTTGYQTACCLADCRPDCCGGRWGGREVPCCPKPRQWVVGGRWA